MQSASSSQRKLTIPANHSTISSVAPPVEESHIGFLKTSTTQYFGEFKEPQLIPFGMGKLYNLNSDTTYLAYWHNDKPISNVLLETKYNSRGQKTQELVYHPKYYDNSTNTGFVCSSIFNKNTIIIQEYGNIVNKKKEGFCVSFNVKDQIRTEGCFKDGKLNGFAEVIELSKQKTTTGVWANDKIISGFSIDCNVSEHWVEQAMDYNFVNELPHPGNVYGRNRFDTMEHKDYFAEHKYSIEETKDSLIRKLNQLEYRFKAVEAEFAKRNTESSDTKSNSVEI